MKETERRPDKLDVFFCARNSKMNGIQFTSFIIISFFDADDDLKLKKVAPALMYYNVYRVLKISEIRRD